MTYLRPPNYSESLPILRELDKYDVSELLVFGTLTHARPPTAETQIKRFEILMDTIGGVNRCYGKRLHWFVRCEGDDKIHSHLHFVLGKHKVADGHTHQFSAEEVCDFLNRNWGEFTEEKKFKRYGITLIKPYIKEDDGIGYICKAPRTEMRADPYLMSDAMRKLLSKGISNAKK